jgi:hypothetical protein
MRPSLWGSRASHARRERLRCCACLPCVGPSPASLAVQDARHNAALAQQLGCYMCEGHGHHRGHRGALLRAPKAEHLEAERGCSCRRGWPAPRPGETHAAGIEVVQERSQVRAAFARGLEGARRGAGTRDASRPQRQHQPAPQRPRTSRQEAEEPAPSARALAQRLCLLARGAPWPLGAWPCALPSRAPPTQRSKYSVRSLRMLHPCCRFLSRSAGA